jgi:hypothetical protein
VFLNAVLSHSRPRQEDSGLFIKHVRRNAFPRVTVSVKLQWVPCCLGRTASSQIHWCGWTKFCCASGSTHGPSCRARSLLTDWRRPLGQTGLWHVSTSISLCHSTSISLCHCPEARAPHTALGPNATRRGAFITTGARPLDRCQNLQDPNSWAAPASLAVAEAMFK